MTTTKVVAWVGAIFGTISVAVLVLSIGAMMYAGHEKAEQQRQQEQTVQALKQGLVKDAQQLSNMEIKPMTEEEERKFWASPSPKK
jgi:hypothetical protein